MPKERTSVPEDVSAEVLFLQDHTCCICREPGKRIQIHHIDGNPTNHFVNNLAVLCFDDHDRTQVRGGFGRTLLAAEVEKYRVDWIARVADRRARADNIAIASMSRTMKPDLSAEWNRPSDTQLIAYIEHLPSLRKVAHDRARNDWDSGVTGQMRGAALEIIDILERVLLHLSAWYPPDHFGPDGAGKYFNDYVASRYLWHRSVSEPAGPGSGGTMIHILTAHGVMEDLSRTVEDMVEALGMGEINLPLWRTKWRVAGRFAPSILERLSEFSSRLFSWLS
ncbi:HNH endonuclease [Bradyrhizobium diazoefficiens]|uniref:HNH endonuclease signature motif containing protein n=1 Tax=Bradyrhizobium diazoefficiens TaxID=1355477 RepID=UPI00190B5D20|nr:HNH endonuclease [Bradyrhizobium diazoefficiens]MBK3659932.1 HNH endonuclease [Bradyrhizobium diazoefficiens]